MKKPLEIWLGNSRSNVDFFNQVISSNFEDQKSRSTHNASLFCKVTCFVSNFLQKTIYVVKIVINNHIDFHFVRHPLWTVLSFPLRKLPIFPLLRSFLAYVTNRQSYAFIKFRCKFLVIMASFVLRDVRVIFQYDLKFAPNMSMYVYLWHELTSSKLEKYRYLS